MLIVLMQLSSVAMARMYQWVDPDTGTTQLSGKPPSWYRSGEPGPRIIVYDNGRIVDDTGIRLATEANDRLRQEALISVELDQAAAMEKLQQARQQKATLDFQNRDEEPLEVIPEVPQQQPATDETSPAAETGPTAEELRALIDQYEQTRTRNAKDLVETVPARE